MIVKIIALILPLSLDTFAVSVALRVGRHVREAAEHLCGIVLVLVAIGLLVAQIAG
jgi:putative Mn2+ efflux pump MntP